MSLSVLLRPVTDDELPGIGELHFRSRAAAYAGFLPPSALTFGSPEAMGEWWAERWRWEHDNHRLTVATVGGELAGFTYLGPDEQPGVGLLNAIHAAPEFVGRGVGRALMLDALTALPAYGDRAVLWVLDGNARARAFYERGGWAADGVTRVDAIGDAPTLQVRYARSLAAGESR